MENRKPNRLKDFDHSNSGYYFVTVCVQDRYEYFGKIINGKIILNEYGCVVKNHWENIPAYYVNVALDEWAIMPNHIHGIIMIPGHKAPDVGTEHCSAPIIIAPTMPSVSIKRVSLSHIMKLFKDAIIKQIRSDFGDIRFSWQRSFYGRIIRNETSLYEIRQYVRNNPSRWDLLKT